MPDVLMASQKGASHSCCQPGKALEHRKRTSSENHEQVPLNFLLLAGRGSRISSECGAGSERQGGDTSKLSRLPFRECLLLNFMK